jgi:hypothetical protein
MFMSHSLAKESRCFEWSSVDVVPAKILLCLLIGPETCSFDTQSSRICFSSSNKRYSRFQSKTVAREILCLVGVSMDAINIWKIFLYCDRRRRQVSIFRSNLET